MKILRSNENGITVRELRNAMQRVVDIDENGDESLAYAAVGNLHVSAVTAIGIDADGDLLLITDHAQAVMEQLDSWDQFIRD